MDTELDNYFFGTFHPIGLEDQSEVDLVINWDALTLLCLCLRPVFALIREGLKLLGFRVKYSKIKGGPILK